MEQIYDIAYHDSHSAHLRDYQKSNQYGLPYVFKERREVSADLEQVIEGLSEGFKITPLSKIIKVGNSTKSITLKAHDKVTGNLLYIELLSFDTSTSEDSKSYDLSYLVAHTDPHVYLLIRNILEKKFSIKYNPPKDTICRVTLPRVDKLTKKIEYDEIEFDLDNFDFSEELYPYINIKELADFFLSSNETILILHGIPGTGKTSLLRYIAVQMYNHYNGGVYYTKNSEVLENERFWAEINNAGLLIMDDFDTNVVKDRSAGTRQVVTNYILDFGQGVFSSGKESKIVICTNQSIEDIDPAILRPGRCCDAINFRALTMSEALHIWTEVFSLHKDQFAQHFGVVKSGRQILQAQLMSVVLAITTGNERNYMIGDTSSSHAITNLKQFRQVTNYHDQDDNSPSENRETQESSCTAREGTEGSQE